MDPKSRSLTRCLCHRASHVPSQRPAAVGTRAYQIESGHQSAAAALPRSCP